jgi:hypothetical protein
LRVQRLGPFITRQQIKARHTKHVVENRTLDWHRISRCQYIDDRCIEGSRINGEGERQVRLLIEING